NKPSGLTCMPNSSHYTHNLSGAIAYYMQNKEENFVVRILNRLDKDTAGIIIVAKDSISQKEIKDVNKIYYAICQGIIDGPLVIDKPIKTISVNGFNQHKREISPDGQAAKTFVTPLKLSKQQNISLIKLELEHGRTHQIRVHLSSIGHPLLGDELYGEKSELISHTALVCKEISFFHPYLNKTLSFEIDFPDDYLFILGALN
ncbi:MAG: RluA family pseudouridine synthase, partial [Clostridia bacterium]|nr:RluA family pseudouridine synthase [Clostridia bacterium]